MSNYAIMRTSKVKSVASMANLEKHCSREKMPKNADASKAELNRNYLQDGMTLPERFRQMTEGQKIRKNAVMGIEVMMTYTPGALDEDKQLVAWQGANVRWLKETFGEDNLVRVWLHRDETTPHLHAFIIPIDEKGKLNCRAFLGGADKLSAMQDSYAAAMKPFDLERGQHGSKAHHTTVKEFYRAIEGAKEQSLPKPEITTEKSLFGKEKTFKEPLSHYYGRANEVYQQKCLQMVDLQEQLKKEKSRSVHEQIERARDKQELRTLRKNKGKIEAWDRLNRGLNELTDKNHAKDLKIELQGILDTQEAKEIHVPKRPAPAPER